MAFIALYNVFRSVTVSVYVAFIALYDVFHTESVSLSVRPDITVMVDWA